LAGGRIGAIPVNLGRHLGWLFGETTSGA